MKKELEGEIFFTPKQAAEHFNLSLSAIKNYIYANKLKTLKTPGGHHRIRKSELLATLGDVIVKKAEGENFISMHNLCSAILAVFKTIGPAGDSLISHSKNVSKLSGIIAMAMRLNESDVKRIEIAALIHDIGHMSLERRVLLKSGKFTHEERELVKNHPIAGEEMLNSIEELKYLKGIIIQHHEWMDGNGYPSGLKGKEISKASRIISVAEAYDSMVSPHSYQKSISKEMAVFELMQHKGTQFDEEVVEVWAKVI